VSDGGQAAHCPAMSSRVCDSAPHTPQSGARGHAGGGPNPRGPSSDGDASQLTLRAALHMGGRCLTDGDTRAARAAVCLS